MTEEKLRKVYDYDQSKVQDTLIRTFHSKGMTATVADIAGLTGLPLNQIKSELPAVVDEYDGRLRVTDKGEILYSFPKGMKSRYKGFVPMARKAWAAIKKGAAAAFKLAFKVWIMTMLVGYFVIFVVLLLLAMVLSMGGGMRGGGGSSDRNDRRGSDSGGGFGGIGGIYLTSRLFDSFVRLWFYSELFRGPENRQRREYDREYDYGEPRPRKPLYKSIYSFVFGDGDPNEHWDQIEKKSVLAFLQTHKGIITLPEFMAITGLEPEKAEQAINRYMLEFEGTPEVTEKGTIYFSFPGLLTRINETPEASGSTIALKKLGQFSSNKPKMNKVFRWINVFNLAFGGYYLWNSVSVGNAFYTVTTEGLALRGGFAYLYSTSAYLFHSFGAANPASGIFWGLGIVPLVFSLLFWAIPAIRDRRLKSENEMIKVENLRRIVCRKIASARELFKPATVSVSVDEAKPADPVAADKIAGQLAAWSGAEVVEDGYLFKEINLTQEEAEKLRTQMDLGTYAPGGTIFDSNA
ncbi:MAG: hypothetical protein LLF89_00860 [Spirochaetaceae bacterium]|nr:hypothetical protein [Spirochaetaceae bacterium]